MASRTRPQLLRSMKPRITVKPRLRSSSVSTRTGVRPPSSRELYQIKEICAAPLPRGGTALVYFKI
jgi:hypothetical protein